MPQKDNFIDKTKDFLRKEVCPLTNTEECEKVIDNYDDHADPLKLVDDIFNTMTQCDLEKCKINEKALKERLENFIKKKHGENSLD